MRYELLGRSLAFALTAGLILVAGVPAALAQAVPQNGNSAQPAATSDAAPAPQPAAAECFPKCRSGYLCHKGACISGCNPPCGDAEKCSPEGECVPKVALAPVAPPAPVEPAPPPVEPPKPPKPPYVPQGVAVGVTLGAATCATANKAGCRTADGDAGIYASVRGGYRFLPWLIVDLDLAVMPLFMKDDVNADRGLLFAAGIGARFLPLGRRHTVDPILGLHVGYLLSYVKDKDDAPSDVETSSTHAVYLGYKAGLDFNLGPVFSLGFVLDVFEPFWISECSTVAGEASCAQVDGAGNNPLYFGAGLSGSFLL